MKIPSLEAVRAEKARRRFADFFRYGWPVLEEDTPLGWNWHIDVVCDHLQAAFEDWLTARDDAAFVQRITRLLINIPPGTAKSRIVSVYFLAWIWLKRPTFKAIFLSSSQFLVLRDSDYCRDVIKSEWYQSWFAPEWKIRGDSDGKAYFRNTAGGWRRAVAFGARLTGERGDMIAWDDPHDATEVESDAKRTTVLEQWDKKIGNRVNDAERSLRIGVMQRLHDEDLSGHVLRQGGWEHLCLPMEYEQVCQCESCQKGQTAIGWSDPRKQGELLFPSRFSAKVLADEMVRLGSYGYAGQMQQRPTPAGGGVFKEKWFGYWQMPGQDLPPVRVKDETGTFIEVFPVTFDPNAEGAEAGHSWDMAFKDSAGSDFVAGLAAMKKGADTFLLHSVNERMDFVKTLIEVPKLVADYPSLLILIEDKANGPAVINVLKNKVPGIVAVNPDKDSKESRANAVAPVPEAGNVYLPHPRNAPWVASWLAQVCSFPNAAHDDMVDAFTQLLARWYAKRDRKKSRWGVA
ncbi:MAG: phage terminase large subunit [Armatimonadota bacterium]